MIYEACSSGLPWFPWFSVFNLPLYLQFSILYIMCCTLISQNLYYNLFYVTLQIALFGFFLALYQLEIFSAFLWLTEVVIILVCLFILFHTNPSGNVSKVITSNYFSKNVSIFVLLSLACFNYNYWLLSEWAVADFLISSFYWEDYYEAHNNDNMNDLYGMFLSFYWFNSLEFLIIGLVLLLGSLLCVQLNKFLKINKSLSYVSFFEIFDYFKEVSKILFLRKQNLVDQANSASNTRFYWRKFVK